MCAEVTAILISLSIYGERVLHSCICRGTPIDTVLELYGTVHSPAVITQNKLTTIREIAENSQINFCILLIVITASVIHGSKGNNIVCRNDSYYECVYTVHNGKRVEDVH